MFFTQFEALKWDFIFWRETFDRAAPVSKNLPDALAPCRSGKRSTATLQHLPNLAVHDRV
jgi:hypothetical protein